ncbi:MAG TPA: LytTR family DNA-binding domain-containing protein [Steroidobacteraceae bacterium]|nr:LytTR family DNA-binding domain-containing protein [Steroidobacteraceae bacterium]
MNPVYFPASFRADDERRGAPGHRSPEALIKLLIVDDEPLARASLTELCIGSNDLQVVGEADSGLAAIRAAGELRPDVMLVDAQLPDMSGFDVLRAASNEHGPLGIVVSSRAADAANALAAGAIDCLLKPVSAERFARSMERARARRVRTGDRPRPPPALLQPGEPAGGADAATPALLIGERGHRLYPLDPLQIEYIESNGNYVTLRTANAEYISRDTVKRLAAVLRSRGFVRIERSLLVNVHAIAYAEPVGRGTFAFTLGSGRCLRSTPTYRDAILRVLPLAQRLHQRGGR